MEKMNIKQIIDYRFLARIVIEAVTPLAVHSGEKEIQTDALVIKDVNGLPYIPGSSIAGVIRHAWKEAGNHVDFLFGFQKNPEEVPEKEPDDEKVPDGMGSRIVFTEARILNSERKVVDGLQPDALNDALLMHYEDLPIRQHVRINHYGVADVDKKGKFDEQVVYAGTRFCFEMEMIGGKREKTIFESLLGILYHSTFRLGSGSRKGFGKIEIKEIQYDELPLNDPRYLKKSSDLENSKVWYKNPAYEPSSLKENWLHHRYNLRPENFFLFGSGYGDDDADMTPVKEKKVTWEGEEGRLGDYEYLIPASSVKGALAHRIAFHYNRLTDFFADDKSEEDIKSHAGSNNEAVKLLFGTEGDEKGNGKQRGNVIFSDMYLNSAHEKLLNHVAIDRFTGGAIDGALFSEKAAYWHDANKDNYPLALDILIDEKRIKTSPIYSKAIKAFNAAMEDLCNGMLPLGGGVNKGHGIFNGIKTK